jgi:hypothetical protein
VFKQLSSSANVLQLKNLCSRLLKQHLGNDCAVEVCQWPLKIKLP